MDKRPNERDGSGGTTTVPVTTSPRLDVDPSSSGLVGQVLDGRYVLEEKLGEGGMGVVFRGRHKVIDKRVAVKVLRGDLASDQEFADRFLNEARAASSIGNPHIVDVADFGKLASGATYFVMEYLEGTSLGSLLADRRPMPVARLVHVAKQIARGLAAAHTAGIVHRDLKPDNVMLVARGGDPDFVKILDFGIAKMNGETGRITKAGSVFGTPHYMSPEQAAGVAVDARTDVYALGVILYEMASGNVPFNADNLMGILTQHMYKAPAPLRVVVPAPHEVPPGLEAIVARCLAKKPEVRYASMDAVAADLERLERGEALDAGGAGPSSYGAPVDYFRTPAMAPWGGGGAPAQKRSWVWLGAAVVTCGAVLAGAAVILSLRGHRDAEREDGARAATSAAAAPSATAGLDPLHDVVVAPDPEDAVLYDGARKLGIGERQVFASGGAPVTVRVEREGFTSRTVVVDGSEARVVVKLSRAEGAPAKPAAGAGSKVVAPRPVTTPAKPAGKPAAGRCPPEMFPNPFTGVCERL